MIQAGGRNTTQVPSIGPVEETLLVLNSHRECGLSGSEAERRLQQYGPNEVIEKKRHPLWLFLKKFWSLSACMLELIALLSFILHKMTDFWIILSLLLFNVILSFIEEERANAVVTALRQKLNVLARVLRDGHWLSISARTLVKGDVVRVRMGDFVPADLQVIEGELKIDQSALTGESRELKMGVNDVVYSGAIVHRGEATGLVIATAAETYFGRATQLVEAARPKLHVEEVIAHVVRWLFIIVGILVVLTLVLSVLKGLAFLNTLPIALLVLMSAIPIALPVMFTVSMALGSAELSRQGVIVTRLNAVEDAASMDVLCADKTGTLTLNQLTLTEVLPSPGHSEIDVIQIGALASKEANADPIDLAFLSALKIRGIATSATEAFSFLPFSAKNRRTEAVVEFDERRIHCVKGALHTVAELVGLDVADIEKLEAIANEKASEGFRTIAVAYADEDAPLTMVGLAFLHDAPRLDSKGLIAELHSLGVKVKMLTGDALPIGREIARELGLNEVARAEDLHALKRDTLMQAAQLAARVDGFAEVFPEDKFIVVESLQTLGHIVGMTGDGVNDAPALRQAEVGIAIRGAADAAKAAASVVLTKEGLSNIIDLVKIGRSIYQRVLTWIINKISRTLMKAGFVVIAFFVTGKFVISALGMILLVFLTDFVVVSLATDRVPHTKTPETWNIGPLVRVAVILGLLMLAEALALLAFGWSYFAIENDPGRLQTFTFQILLFLGIFSIISARERRLFWASWPSMTFVIAIVFESLTGLLIGLWGLGDLQPLPSMHSLFVIISAAILTLGPNDLIKMMLTKRAIKMMHPL